MLEKIKELICEFVEVNPDDIKPESNFSEDLGFNSYDFMCMLGNAEDEFDIEIDEDAAAKSKTVQELIDYLEGLN